MRKHRRTHLRSTRRVKKISFFKPLVIGLAFLVFVAGAFVGFRRLTRVSAVDSPFTFTVAGDWGSGTNAQNNLALIPSTGSMFTIVPGDLAYASSTSANKEPQWCQMVKAKVGDTYPFQLVTGNHENVLSTGTLIENYVACLPDRMNSVTSPYGVYGREYYFDYNGVRFFMLSPEMLDMAGDPYSYDVESNRFFWVRDRVREAKAANMWVVVGMHRVCISMGRYACETQNLMDMLIEEHADLVFTGHEHNYQRSKQVTCITPGFYKSSCTAAFEARGGTYIQGAGTTIVTVGTGGVSLYDVFATDPDAQYFAAYSGKNINPRYGIVKAYVTPTGMSLDFVGSGTGTFTDHFEIMAASAPAVIPSTTLAGTLLADAVIQQSYPASNYGRLTSLSADASPVKDILLKFDVSGLLGRPVLKAKLRLFSVDQSSWSGLVYRTANTSWIESGTGGVTWNTAPPGDTAPVGTIGRTYANRWYEIDVTDAVSGDGVVGFRIKSTSTDGAAYTAREGGATMAKLLVTVADGSLPTPTPTSVMVPTDTPVATATPLATPIPTPGSPGELIIPVESDATVKMGYPTRNYGSAASLEVDNSPEVDFLLRFAVTGLTGHQLTGAQIRMYNINSSSKGGAFYTAGNAWTETGVTWNTAPSAETLVGSLGSVNGSSTTPRLFAADVTSAISGDGIYTFRIQGASTDGADYVSRQGAGGQIPVLVIGYR